MFTQRTDLRVCESFKKDSVELQGFKKDSCEKHYLKADWQLFDPNANMDTVMKGLLMNASQSTSSHGIRLQGSKFKKR